MIIPDEMQSAVKLIADRIGISAVEKGAEDISRMYRSSAARGVTSLAEAAAYAAVRAPASYCAVKESLEHVLERIAGRAAFKTALDIGSGTGAAVWAADDTLPGAEKFTRCEKEPFMTEIAEAVLCYNPALAEKISRVDGDFLKCEFNGKFDAVIASYALNELEPPAYLDAAAKAVSLLNDGGILLIAEPGTPRSFTIIKEIKQALIDRGFTVIAPCFYFPGCPMPENDWCSFACRVPRSALHKKAKGADVPYEDESYIYIAVTNSPDIIKNDAGARVIKRPGRYKGYVSLTVCGAGGIKKLIYSKKDGEIYKRASKLKIGDMINL